MDKKAREEWIKAFIEHLSTQKITFLKEEKGILKGFSAQKESRPLFVYSEKLALLLPYLNDTKYLILPYNQKNLEDIENEWDSLKINSHIILCLIDFVTMNYALLKPFAHSMVVKKEHLRKSIASLFNS